jgi:hypothetical protein
MDAGLPGARIRVTVTVLAIVLCIGRLALADPQQRPAPPAATGVIAGALTSADLGRPVRRAQVKIVSAAPRLTRTVTTDANGAYVFTNVPAGEYTLSASKPGYLDTVYGARRPGAAVPGTPIRLGAGEKRDQLALRLPRGGVISGVITDEFGDPALGVPVRAMRFTFTNGERSAYPAGNVVTNDLGEYRIAGLMPGDYVVSAVPRDNVAAESAMAESLRNRVAQVQAAGGMREIQPGAEAGKPPDATGYVPVYFGGTSSPSAATPVRLGLSGHAGAVDIQLQVMKTAVISGVVTNPDGTPVSANIQLIDPSMPIANLGVWFRNSTPGGKFSFPGLVPGSYVINAHAGSSASAAGQLTAVVSVPVEAGGAAEVTVTLQRGVSVSGGVALDTPGAAVDVRRLRVNLARVATTADWESEMKSAPPDAEGRFVLRGVAPGRYRVTVTGLPNGWMLASALFDGKDAADHHLVVEAGENVAGGEIKVTARSSEVAGTLTNASGEPAADRSLVLFPSDRARWLPQSRLIHVAQPAADGRYAIRGLPAGEYLVAAVEAPEPGQAFDPAFLSQIASVAVTLKLGLGERLTHDIRVR